MKRTTNKYQKAYMTAKARVQEIESRQEAIEKKYISDNDIVNPDGSVPEFLYCCLLYTSPSPRDRTRSRMPSSA